MHRLPICRNLSRPRFITRSPVLHRRLVTASSSPSPGPQLPGQDDDPDGGPKSRKTSSAEAQSDEGQWRSTAFKMFESSMTTFASVAVLGMVGYGYTLYYKRLVLKKMEHAFEPGDPVLELAEKDHLIQPIGPPDNSDHTHWIERPQQSILDAIVSGRTTGQYHLIVGEKGTGKSSMLIDAMAKIDGEGVAMFEAHADPEIFRVRLGRALDFEYHEDNIGSLFSIRGPRDASALLDIERALNKLEKVALRRRAKIGRPLVLIVNSAHLVRDDDDGRNLIELIQQRAEEWAASNLATVIFNSDDYWVYERLKGYATRLNVIPVWDLAKPEAMGALRNYRQKYFGHTPSDTTLGHIYNRIGGRLAFLNRVAKSDNMLATCEDICQMEKTWLYNKCWILGEEMDDDVMDQQKYASAAMVLAKALVDQEKEMESTYHEETGHILPEISLHEARQIMTRADFIQSYDAINIFTIDSKANVRADSVPMMNAFREICNRKGFSEHLDATLERISAIESLGRTRELTLKDLWDNGRYSMSVRDGRDKVVQTIEFGNQAKREKDAADEEETT